VAVRANDLTLTYLLQQARVRQTLGDEVGYGCLFNAALAVVELHHPRVKPSAAVRARAFFIPQQDHAQASALPVLVAAILLYEPGLILPVIVPMVSPLA
jgi:hypothetical protein